MQKRILANGSLEPISKKPCLNQKPCLDKKPNLYIKHNALSKELLNRAHTLFFKSENIQYLSPEENRVLIYGEYKEVPRKQAVYSVPGGLSYNFSGTCLKARDESEVPLLKEIRQEIEKIVTQDLVATRGQLVTGGQFNFAFINYYETGQNTIGWHADDERDMVDGAMIASISFGATRDFDFRLKTNHDMKHREVLKDNTLCLMLFPTNKEWQHSLPKRTKCNEPRVNITFRLFK